MAGGLISRAGRAAHVAGGRGFLGKAIARALERAGWRVSVSGREGAPQVDRADEELLVWCAGGRGGREGAPAALWHVHVEAACAAVRERPALRSMIYVSSGEVYGDQAVPFAEQAPRLGKSEYALAKIRGEDALSGLCWQRDVALAIVRPSVIYGPEQAQGMLLPSAIRALLDGRDFPATAGEQTRDWIFIEDAAACIAAIAARHPPHLCNLYNVASGEERSVRSALTLAAKLVGAPAEERIQWGARAYREHETMRYALSAERARRDLAWAPRTSFEDGLALCIEAARRGR